MSGYDATVYLPHDYDPNPDYGHAPGCVRVYTTTTTDADTICIDAEELGGGRAILDDVPPEVARAIAQVLNEAADHIDPGDSGD